MVKAAGELLVLWPDLPYSLGSHWFLWSGEEGCPQDKLSKDAAVLAQLFPLSSKGKASITFSEKSDWSSTLENPLLNTPMISIKKERIPLRNHFHPPGSLLITYQTAASGFPMQNNYLQETLTVFLPLHKSSCATPHLQLVTWQESYPKTDRLPITATASGSAPSQHVIT